MSKYNSKLTSQLINFLDKNNPQYKAARACIDKNPELINFIKVVDRYETASLLELVRRYPDTQEKIEFIRFIANHPSFTQFAYGEKHIMFPVIQNIELEIFKILISVAEKHPEILIIKNSSTYLSTYYRLKQDIAHNQNVIDYHNGKVIEGIETVWDLRGIAQSDPQEAQAENIKLNEMVNLIMPLTVKYAIKKDDVQLLAQVLNGEDFPFDKATFSDKNKENLISVYNLNLGPKLRAFYKEWSSDLDGMAKIASTTNKILNGLTQNTMFKVKQYNERVAPAVDNLQKLSGHNPKRN